MPSTAYESLTSCLAHALLDSCRDPGSEQPQFGGLGSRARRLHRQASRKVWPLGLSPPALRTARRAMAIRVGDILQQVVTGTLLGER